MLLHNAAFFSLDPLGRFYVIDKENNQLIQLDSDGSLLKKIGGYGWSELSFDTPSDLSTQNGLDIYVADYGNHRVQHFDQNLNYVSSLSFRENDRPAERFGYPAGVAVSSQGDLFLSDQENSRVIKITGNATFDKAFGGIDAGSGRLQHPSRLRVSAQGRVYVQDGNVLKVFDVFGNYLQTIGEGLFRSLRSFQLEQDTICVLDGCTIMLLNERGITQNIIDLSSVFQENEQCVIRDVFIRERILYILTSGSILSMPVVHEE